MQLTSFLGRLWRCQGFFHSSEVCYFPIKGVKCASSHRAKDCPFDFDSPLKYSKCGGDLVANWGHCPCFPEGKKSRLSTKPKSKNKSPPIPQLITKLKPDHSGLFAVTT
ncbi:hypothetical protein NPIL_519381 [Nephila pilipes]|uniref:Uncharacterized protein n=1 Tax=Nephila pilipes TaxID=299642 RepID=A0A8X6NH17_NEPPI|nr:hypothetical protein NPIL_519381 [Nephila pilipes]